MGSTNGKTVRLNVGGRKYEVAKSTIEKYPDTMLARMISDNWQQQQQQTKDGKQKEGNDSNDDDEIFIDADGLQFRFVLEYMRHQKIDLPMNIAKDAVLKDLQYFGFENVPADAINYSGATAETRSEVSGRASARAVKLVNRSVPPSQTACTTIRFYVHQRKITPIKYAHIFPTKRV